MIMINVQKESNANIDSFLLQYSLDMIIKKISGYLLLNN